MATFDLYFGSAGNAQSVTLYLPSDSVKHEAMPDRAFPLLGGVHVGIILGTVAIPAALALVARRIPQSANPIRWGLAAILVGNCILSVWLGILWRGGFFANSNLPMHFCDWALVATIGALASKNQRVFEVAYFWGLAGTLQGILTPDLNADLPFLRYLTFFVTHCGIVAGVLFQTWGMGFRAESNAVWRVFGWTQLYLVSATVVDWLTGANYGYLRAKPTGASLLDLLGEWPWYLVSMEMIALFLYFILDLPFILSKRGKPESGTEGFTRCNF